MDARKKRQLKVEQDDVFVIDGALPSGMVEELYGRLVKSAYSLGEISGGDGIERPHFSVDFDLDSFCETPLSNILSELIVEQYGEHQRCYRAYCNLMIDGHTGGTHSDCAKAWNDISGIVFLCPEWKKNWCGELLFMDSHGDAVSAVSPRPGRIVLFRGRTLHHPIPPSVVATIPRLTVAVKCRDFRRNAVDQHELYAALFPNEEDPEMQARLIQMIGMVEDPGANETLEGIANASSLPTAGRAMAMTMLLQRRKEEGTKWAHRWLDSPLPEIRSAAVMAIVRGLGTVGRELVKTHFSSEKNPTVADACLEALRPVPLFLSRHDRVG